MRKPHTKLCKEQKEMSGNKKQLKMQRLSFLIIREILITAKLQYHFFSTMTLPKKQKFDNLFLRQECKESDTMTHCWWECKIAQLLRK